MEDLAALEEKEEHLLEVVGGGYPGAGIGGGRSWPEVVETTLMEAVAFHGGAGEQEENAIGENGLGGQTKTSLSSSGGGGYFTGGLGNASVKLGTSKVGGQGGKWLNIQNTHERDDYYKALGIYTQAIAGAGAASGKGGNIKVSKNVIIYAYNGDRVTNDDYSATYNEYDKNGNKLSTTFNVITRKDGKKIIPTTIFAQSGVIRATYTTDISKEELAKVKTGKTYNVITATANTRSVLATNETSTATTGYKNGYKENQGIGSGAGYLEQSNGTYKVDSSLN